MVVNLLLLFMNDYGKFPDSTPKNVHILHFSNQYYLQYCHYIAYLLHHIVIIIIIILIVFIGQTGNITVGFQCSKEMCHHITGGPNDCDTGPTQETWLDKPNPSVHTSSESNHRMGSH